MGAAAVSLWTTCLKGLEKLATEPPHSAAADFVLKRVVTGCDSLRGLPAPPRATWKKVVVELKVPLRLFSACSTAAEAQPKSTLLVGATAAVYAFLETFGDFLLGMSRPTGNANSILATVQRQLQQSGLLQQLPALLATAADELNKQQANQGSSDSISSSMSTSATIAGSAAYRGFICSHAVYMLCIHWRTSGLWQGLQTERSAIAAASAPAAVRLALAAMQYADSRVRAVPQTQQRSPADAGTLHCLLISAHVCIINLANTMSVAMSPPDVLSNPQEVNWKHLFQSPHPLPCLALMVSVLATRLLSTPAAGLTSSVITTSSSSSSSTASGPSYSHSGHQPNRRSLQQRVHAHNQDSRRGALEVLDCSDEAQAMQAWQQACAKLPHLTASHHKLFELLGVDSRTVLWTAAPLGESARSLLSILQAYTVLVRQWEQFHHMWQGLDPQVHLLLPAIVLQCVAGMPADSNAECCLVAVSVLVYSTAYWRCLIQPSHAARAVADFAEVRPQQQLEALAQQEAQQQEEQEVLLPAAFVNEVLSHILRLSSQLQASIHNDAAVDAALAQQSSALAGEDTSTGSGNQGLSTTADKLAALKGVVTTLHLLFNRSATSGTPAGLLQPVAGMATTTTAAVAAAAAPQTMEAGQHLHAAAAEVQLYFKLEAFQHHALQIVASVEGVARRMAAAPPATHQECDSGILMVMSCFCHDDKPGAASRGPLLIMARTAGPGSPEQRQLYSLLSSMLKLRHSSMEGVHSAINHCRMAAAAAVVALLSQQAGGNTAAAVSNTAANAVPADLSDLLPSLFIFGCCCLQWAEQLQQEIPSRLLQQGDPGQQAASDAPSRNVLEVCSDKPATLDAYSASQMCFHLLPSDDGRASLLLGWLLALGGWVQSSNTSAQLVSAGYDPEHLLQQLHGIAAALRTAVGNRAGDAHLSNVVQQLRDLGVGLSSVATPHACNNPNCSNISGPSELQLVSGRSCMCAGCRTARYCSKACQKQHWKQHKPTCKALATAAAAAASVAGAVVAAPT